MKMAINNSDDLPEYLKIKYEIPSGVLVIFSFDYNEIYTNDSNFVTKVDPKDIPEDWSNMIPIVRIKLEERPVSLPRITEIQMGDLGNVTFWD